MEVRTSLESDIHGMGHGGFLKLGDTLLGVPRIRTIVYWGLYWGPRIQGNYHIHACPLLEVWVQQLSGAAAPLQ